MKKILAAAAAMLTVYGAYAAKPTYLDTEKPIEQRVEDALSRLTTAEKVALLHAHSKFSSAGVPRLGIPDLWCTDGPHGIRPEVLWDEWDQAGWTNDSCVAFPALTALAATWNPEMSRQYGKAIGEEALYRNKQVLLGPGVNIYRTPLNGRNFEYMGEDPYLASQMVVPYIRGVQKNGVATCVKHFCLNNHEANRHTTNVIVDDRTLYEIYLPAFKSAVLDGGTWTIMGAYNLYNNEHLCHNSVILNKILKGEWGFPGAVVSDWGGVHDTDQAITNGMDLEFGSWTNGLSSGKKNAYDSYYLADPYKERLASGKADPKVLDDKVRRVLRLMMLTSLNGNDATGSMCSDEHYAAARRIGNEAIVLLKNDGNLLPLADGKKVLVVGENAIKMMTVGGGSSSLKVQHEIIPLDGLKASAAKHGLTVDYARGYVGDTGGEYNGVVTGQDLNDNRTPEQLIAEAVDKAKNADYVIFVGGLNKANHQDAEDSDREGLGLPYGQDAVIEALAAANPNTIVVNISGNAVAMPWADKVPAILQAWFLGSEAGNSIADILTGDANPSGKLPFTFPLKLADNSVHHIVGTGKEYLGTKRANEDIYDVEYKDGVLVGYRWHDTKKIKPLFPFGHGLSYTTFAYGKPTLSAPSMSATPAITGEATLSHSPEQMRRASIAAGNAITITVPVTNTGSREGSETVQLYLTDVKAPVARPAKELKGFAKVSLKPGETKDVTFTVTPDDLAYFDADAHAWAVHPGRYRASIARSAGDVASTLNFTLK